MNKVLMIGIVVLPLVTFLAFFGREILDSDGLVAKGFQNAGLIALVSGVAITVFHLYKIILSNTESRVRIALMSAIDRHPGIYQEELFKLARKDIPLWFLFSGYFYSMLDSLHMNGKIELMDGKWYPPRNLAEKLIDAH